MSAWHSQHLPPSLGSGQMFATVNTYQRSSPTYQRASPKLQRVPENDEVNLDDKGSSCQDKQRVISGTMRTQDWTHYGHRTGNYILLQSTVVRLFRENGARLAPGEMGEVHQCIRKILSSKTGQFLLDYYKQELTKGMIIIREGIKLEEGLSLITKLEKMWDHFFTKILPTLEALMYPLKTKGSQAIRQTTLIAFRDIVVLKISLDAAIRLHTNSVPPGIKHMLLILQTVHDSYPPNKHKQQLEGLVAMVVIPYLGYRGLYQGQKEPFIVSSEPAIVSRKKSEELAAAGRRVSRPLSVQPRQLENLQDLFLKAIRKEQASSFAR